MSKSNSGSLPLTLDEPLTIPSALLGKISYKKWKFLLCLVLTCRSLVTSFGWCHLRKCIIDMKNECHGIHQLKSKKKRRNLWILSNQQLIFSSTHNSMIYFLISPYWTIFNLNLFSLFGIEMRELKFKFSTLEKKRYLIFNSGMSCERSGTWGNHLLLSFFNIGDNILQLRRPFVELLTSGSNQLRVTLYVPGSFVKSNHTCYAPNQKTLALQ